MRDLDIRSCDIRKFRGIFCQLLLLMGTLHRHSVPARKEIEEIRALLKESCSESYHGGDVDVVGVWVSEVVLTALQMHNGILLTSLPMAGLHKIGLFLLHSFTMGPGNVEIAK